MFTWLAARMRRESGTYNRQDPTEFIRWTWGRLTLNDVTWGIEVKWRGHRIAYRDMADRRFRLRWIAWLVAGLESAHARRAESLDADPLGGRGWYE